LECLTKFDGENKSLAKIKYLTLVSELMPGGKPDYLSVINYPMIRVLLNQMDRQYLLFIISMLVRDYCSSVNVVRNMNEDQMIEAASMLIDECGNFRIEDYIMMFQMAKKGELVTLRDRVDLVVITAMLDKYWERRRDAAIAQEEAEDASIDSLGDTGRLFAKDQVFNEKTGMYEDAKDLSSVGFIGEAFGNLKNALANKLIPGENISEKEALSQVVVPDISFEFKPDEKTGYKSIVKKENK